MIEEMDTIEVIDDDTRELIEKRVPGLFLCINDKRGQRSAFSYRSLGRQSHVEEVIAIVADYATACSAFEEAVKRRPSRIITLRRESSGKADDVGALLRTRD
jgi:hypothetical protein